MLDEMRALRVGEAPQQQEDGAGDGDREVPEGEAGEEAEDQAGEEPEDEAMDVDAGEVQGGPVMAAVEAVVPAPVAAPPPLAGPGALPPVLVNVEPRRPTGLFGLFAGTFQKVRYIPKLFCCGQWKVVALLRTG